MTIPQRILLNVTIAAGLVVAVATLVTYRIVYLEARDRDLNHLETYVKERARREEIGFRQVQGNLELVRGQFLKRIAAPVPGDYEAQWNDRFQLFADGAWRSRTNFADGRKFSTLWAHRNVVFTPELKQQVLHAQNICDDLLPGWVDAFPSVYFVLPGWLNIGFDPRLANWVWDTPSDYDPSSLEWFQLAMQTNHPSEGIAWSGVIEEPTTKMPIVSVYLPIVRDGKFIGSVGHDLFVNRLMEESARSDLPGTMHVIFRADGRLIAHPDKRAEILSSKGQLRVQHSGDAALESLHRAIEGHSERRFSGFDAASGLYFSVARLAGPEWLFVTTVPRGLLQQLAFQSAQWVLWSGLASLTLMLSFLAITLRRQIAVPLAELNRATKQMSAGDTSARVVVERHDEFGSLAGSFNEMAGRVAQRDAELQAEKAALERRVAERTAELRESESRFVTAFRNSPVMQSIVRASDRVIVEVNDTFLNRLGFSREQTVGNTAVEMNFWVDPEELAGYAREIASAGFVQAREVRLRAGDGRVLTVLLSTQPAPFCHRQSRGRSRPWRRYRWCRWCCAASSHEQGGASSSAASSRARLVLGQRHADHPGGGDEHLIPRAAQGRGDLRHDRLHRLAPAITGEGVGIAGVDDQRPGAALPHVLAAQFNFGGAADVAGEHPCHRRALGQFDIGQVAAAPVLVAGARDARVTPAIGGSAGKG